ncbi:MAG: hypothetical protein NUV34_11735 [Sulfuricaulis sp.]|nr:hypothetical protein [Sulfuricaulis sp.]
MAGTTGVAALVEREIRDAPATVREVAHELGLRLKPVRKAVKYLVKCGRIATLSRVKDTRKCGSKASIYVYIPLKDRMDVMVRGNRVVRRDGKILIARGETLAVTLPDRAYQGRVESPEMISE